MNSLREFAKYISLSVLTMFSVSAYILADTFFIAFDMGAYGLAALNFAIPIYGVIFAMSLMLGIGGATRFSMLRSEGREEDARRVYTTTLISAAVLSLVVVVVGGTFAREISAFMGAYGAVLELTTTYLRTIALFGPAFLGCHVLASFARNDGAPVRSMAALAGNSMLNILLDYVFMFMLGWGMFGAALATGVSHTIGMFILIPHFWGHKLPRPNWAELGKMLSIGLPTFISNVSLGIVIAVFNVIVLGISGNVGVAAYGVLVNVLIVLVSIYDGIAQGVQPLMSRDRAKARLYLRYAMVTVLTISLVVYVGVFFGADSLASIFNSENNEEFQQLAVYGMRIYFSGIVFIGFNIITAIYFTSVGNPRPAQIVSVLRGFVVILPVVAILSSIAGLTGVWLTLPISEAGVAVVAASFLLRGIKHAA